MCSSLPSYASCESSHIRTPRQPTVQNTTHLTGSFLFFPVHENQPSDQTLYRDFVVIELLDYHETGKTSSSLETAVTAMDASSKPGASQVLPNQALELASHGADLSRMSYTEGRLQCAPLLLLAASKQTWQTWQIRSSSFRFSLLASPLPTCWPSSVDTGETPRSPESIMTSSSGNASGVGPARG